MLQHVGSSGQVGWCRCFLSAEGVVKREDGCPNRDDLLICGEELKYSEHKSIQRHET